MTETTSSPGATSIVTSAFTAPFSTLRTVPGSTFRALILMVPPCSEAGAQAGIVTASRLRESIRQDVFLIEEVARTNADGYAVRNREIHAQVRRHIVAGFVVDRHGGGGGCHTIRGNVDVGYDAETRERRP